MNDNSDSSEKITVMRDWHSESSDSSVSMYSSDTSNISDRNDNSDSNNISDGGDNM